VSGKQKENRENKRENKEGKKSKRERERGKKERTRSVRERYRYIYTETEKKTRTMILLEGPSRVLQQVLHTRVKK
jgi:hypothetical protein